MKRYYKIFSFTGDVQSARIYKLTLLTNDVLYQTFDEAEQKLLELIADGQHFLILPVYVNPR